MAAGGAQILVVDDDRLVAKMVGTMLRDLGEVTVADSGEAAEPMLAERPWDAILVDVELPGMGGLDFLEIARRARPETGIVVLSSHAEHAFAEVARRAGADEYLTKPIAPANLEAKVSGLIGLAARRRG